MNRAPDWSVEDCCENCSFHHYIYKRFSLFHCSYFIKQSPNGFPCRIDPSSMHLGICSTFGKRKKTFACGS